MVIYIEFKSVFVSDLLFVAFAFLLHLDSLDLICTRLTRSISVNDAK
ncbi:MAG: hypothetical protein OFPI_20780 [Osedax symbiont Rs2]|nr:MAG: hypothetical protein OFPI_20780 [Osedax symbiont Rs2]